MKSSQVAETTLRLWPKFVAALAGRPLDALAKSNFVEASDYQVLAETSATADLDHVQGLIAANISKNRPFLASRLGSTELRVLLKHRSRTEFNFGTRLYKTIANLEWPAWSSWEHRNIRSQSGFFPVSEATVNRFSRLTRDALKEVDLLGSWVPGENQFSSELRGATITKRSNLEPFFAKSPWTLALENKRVLLVHPFVATIQQQLERRQSIHHRALLPECEIMLVRPPQTLAANTEGFESWFSAFSKLKADCLRVEFDVAILSCGAYGLPLGALLRSKGKTVIHLGGVTQLLFGVRGRRWAGLDAYQNLATDSWTDVLDVDRPPGYQNVDGGVYW